ncbi:MAG: PAS domain S-box protein, partial [Nitrospiraceae bacterium]
MHMHAFYQDIVSALPLGVAVYDESGHCVAANDALCGIIGATREQLLAQNYHHVDSWKQHGLMEAARSAIRNNRAVQHECTLTTNVGCRATMNCYLEPFTSGKRQFLLLIVRDISEQKSAEDSLRISEKKIELALDGADLAFWIWNVPEGTTFFSPRYFSMLGYEKDELPHSFDTWEGLLHPDDRGRATDEVLKAIEGKKSWSIEFRLRAKSGDFRWILGRGRVLEYDQAGGPLVAAGTHLDVTERKEVEAAVIEEKNKLEAVMAALSDGITVQDRDFRILYQNDAHSKMQGSHRGEFCFKAYQNRDDICPRCLVARSFADGQVHRNETTAIGRNGETIYLEVSSSPIRNAQGEITAVVEAVRDITEQKKLENEA